MRASSALVLLLIVLSVVSGCGGGAYQYDLVPVSGVATCEGKPVANAIVNFTPQGAEDRPSGRPGAPAFGKTDDQGRFQLSTYNDDDGAIVGTHTVTIGLAPTDDSVSGRPAKFSCADASLQVTVEPGMEELQLDF